MGKQSILILVLCIVVTTANAQKKSLSFKQVDSTSYALYLKQDWKSLITLGKKSRDEGIDFYYLKVRMGIAYYKEGKMLSAIKFLEEANKIDSHDVVVQEYLYWAYKFGGLVLESRLFYTKISKNIQDKIALDLPFITAIDLSVLATNNLDYTKMLKTNEPSESGDNRYFTENYQLFSLGMNHPLSKKVNFYQRLSVLPTASYYQENTSGELVNKSYNGSETRYYGDVTVSLGNRLYLDTYVNFLLGKYDNLNVDSELSGRGPRGGTTTSTSSTIRYTNFVFGVALTKASYYTRSTVNISVSNLNGYNQFQGGYTLSLYPLGSTFIVPFGAVQYQNENENSNMVYTGGLSLNTEKISITGYGNIGNIRNFIASNGAIIYNQTETALNEYGLTFQFYTKKTVVKIGYSFMEMKDYYNNQNQEITSKAFNFNQQNIIAGITWEF
ncbi:hypothetical protein [Lutibacter sp.]